VVSIGLDSDLHYIAPTSTGITNGGGGQIGAFEPWIISNNDVFVDWTSDDIVWPNRGRFGFYLPFSYTSKSQTSSQRGWFFQLGLIEANEDDSAPGVLSLEIRWYTSSVFYYRLRHSTPNGGHTYTTFSSYTWPTSGNIYFGIEAVDIYNGNMQVHVGYKSFDYGVTESGMIDKLAAGDYTFLTDWEGGNTYGGLNWHASHNTTNANWNPAKNQKVRAFFRLFNVNNADYTVNTFAGLQVGAPFGGLFTDF